MIGRVLISFALAAVPVSVRASAGFEAPSREQRIPAPARGDVAIEEIRCTWFPGLMVRESGTDTPGPAAASIVADGAAACTRAVPKGSTTLKTEGFGFVGKAAGLLFFSAADPNGAIPFKVVDGIRGTVVYTDGTIAPNDLRVAPLDDGRVELWFTRGLNAPCSLMQGGACWARLVREGMVPRTLAAPGAAACVEAYRRMPAPADDPSIVSYAVHMRLDARGRAEVLSRGPVGCAPLP